MEGVWMKIDKFGEEPVKIQPDHPLAVAQRAKDAERAEAAAKKAANTKTAKE